MLPLSLELKIASYCIALAGVLGALAWVHHDGATRERAKWEAQQLEDQQAADAQRETQRLRAQAAATDYEAQRAAAVRRAATPSPEAANALHATICPASGPSKPLELGDVSVPAVWVDRLRDAGADYTGSH